MKTKFYCGESRSGELFFMLPKALFTEPKLEKLSLEAKLIYSFMFDRAGMQGKDGQKDENGRIYIHFTVEETASVLKCSNDKAIKVLKELETINGNGLIERKKMGRGKPSRVFIKKIISESENPNSSEFKNSCNRSTSYRENRCLEFGNLDAYKNNNIKNKKNIIKKSAHENFSLSGNDIEEYLLFCERSTGLRE